MSRKGNSRHIKRLAASTYMGIERKVDKYTAKPKPGRYTLKRNTSAMSLLRDKLRITKTSLEAKRAIKQGSLEINGSKVKDERYPIGFGDVVHVVQTNAYYQVGINRQRALTLEKTGEATKRIAKVVGKYMVKGKKLMLRLNDGSVIAADKPASVNDSVTISKGKVDSVIKFEKGANCVVFRGAHSSETGVVKGFNANGEFRKAEVTVDANGKEFETLVDNVIVIGA